MNATVVGCYIKIEFQSNLRLQVGPWSEGRRDVEPLNGHAAGLPGQRVADMVNVVVLVGTDQMGVMLMVVVVVLVVTVDRRRVVGAQMLVGHQLGNHDPMYTDKELNRKKRKEKMSSFLILFKIYFWLWSMWRKNMGVAVHARMKTI